MVKVSVVSCEDYDETSLKEKISKSLENIGGLASFIKSGDSVLLKPNLLSAKPHSTCITTNPFFVKAVAELMKDFGCNVTVGDSPPVQNCHKVAKKSGLFDELKKIDVNLIEFKTPVKLELGEYAIFQDLYVAKEVLDFDHVVNLPKIKSHTQMTLTACVKNMFGVVVGKEKALWHLKAGISKEYFSRMLMELYYGISPAITIADMITVMEGNGPSSGTPKHVGAIVAGTDSTALDRVICDILNIPINIVYTLKEANALAYRSADLDNIEIVSEGLDGIRKNAKGFKLPRKTDFDFGLPAPFKKLLRDQLTSKPVIDTKKCEYCKSCEEICPVDAVKVTKERISFDYDKCIKCYCCQEICSYKALKVKQGFLLKILNMFD
jgi:uncharacterized protein (DUF362 family)/ferredoxin